MFKAGEGDLQPQPVRRRQNARNQHLPPSVPGPRSVWAWYLFQNRLKNGPDTITTWFQTRLQSFPFGGAEPTGLSADKPRPSWPAPCPREERAQVYPPQEDKF